jgi:hypothetical protein
MAIVVANGGRFNVWDSPTPESGLTPGRHEFLAKHVAPWLADRKAWCLRSTRLPDVSLLNASAAHYAVTDAAGPVCFSRRDNRIEGAANLLPRLHLNYEMVGDWRLHDQDVRSPLLLVEHVKRLTERDVNALVEFVRRGGKVLLSAMGVNHGRGQPLHNVFGIRNIVGPKSAEQLTVEAGDGNYAFAHHLFRYDLTTAETMIEAKDASGQRSPLLTRNRFGEGEAYYFATPMLTAHGSSAVPLGLLRETFRMVAPPKDRRVTVAAPESVEMVLRKQGSSLVLHLVNMAAGKRETVTRGRRRYVTIRSLPKVPPCRFSVRAEQKPARVVLQPQGTVQTSWRYEDGRVHGIVPQFEVHQMVVLEFVVRLNNKKVVDYTEPENTERPRSRRGRLIDPSDGAIALQAHDPGSVYYFKEVRIREFP